MAHDEIARALGRVEEKVDQVLASQSAHASRMDAMDSRVASLEVSRDRIKVIHRTVSWAVGAAITIGGAALALWEVAKGRPQP